MYFTSWKLCVIHTYIRTYVCEAFVQSSEGREAAGLDGMTGRVLKECVDQLSCTCSNPSSQRAWSLPQLSHCQKSLISDYRPVALTQSLWIVWRGWSSSTSKPASHPSLTHTSLLTEQIVLLYMPLSHLPHHHTHDCAPTHSTDIIIKFSSNTTVAGLTSGSNEAAYLSPTTGSVVFRQHSDPEHHRGTYNRHPIRTLVQTLYPFSSTETVRKGSLCSDFWACTFQRISPGLQTPPQ